MVWKAGGVNGTWTDGSAVLGPNDVVYAVNTFAFGPAGVDAPGGLTAYRLSDGHMLWSIKTPRPPNNVPAVGQLVGQTGLSVVQPVGQQCVKGGITDVHAYDAATGEHQWVFNGPTQDTTWQAGEMEGSSARMMAGIRAITLPNPWSAPTVANGNVYVGNEMGPLYALRDADGDGHIAGEAEVSRFDTSACFTGSSSPAHAPGLMAAASIDTLYVFKS